MLTTSHYFYITPDEYAKAEVNGVSRATLEQRIRLLAWEKEKAISTPPHKKNSIKEYVPLAEKNGICYSTLRHRINQEGLDPIEAATKPLQDKRKLAEKAREACRVYPKEIVALLDKSGISYNNFRQRAKSGWDLYEAATRPLMTKREIGLMTKGKRKEIHVY